MKKIFISALGLLVLVGCSSPATPAEPTPETTEPEPTPETTDSGTSSPTVFEKPSTPTSTLVVGDDTLGYVEIDSTWLPFQDTDPTVTATQFSDEEGSYILSLDTVVWPDEVAAADRTAEMAATNIWNNLEVQGYSETSGATVDFPNVDLDVYEVYGFYDDGEGVLICWLMDDDQGVTHYMSLEGPYTEEILNYYMLAGATYSFTE